MRRIDHLLFRGDTDFIAYFDAQPLPGCDMGIEPCGCFAFFIADKIKADRSVEAAFEAIEDIIQDGGWNAEQLRLSFFPALSNILGSSVYANSAESFMRPLSKKIWNSIRITEPNKII